MRTDARTGTPPLSVDELREKAREIRRLILTSVHHAGAGHLGGPLSAADMLAALYFRFLRVDPVDPAWAERDRLILSKGHSAIGLYATLALRGYFPIEELQTFDAIDSRLQGHPDMTVTPGVDMSTGSLGQGLSPGVGIALGAKLKSLAFRTWVMLGDGEMQEGQVWEAIEVAARYGLDNLTAIVDNNRLPQYTWPDFGQRGRGRPIAALPEKWRAFGWHVIECDGHDMAEIIRAFDAATRADSGPAVVIAHTVKGKGVSFMENEFAWHAKPLGDGDLARALAEIEGAP
ncbi:MAG: transketolase [Chloroflexota bacterium]|nr:transketolase [Chloroflexota bacterium]